MSERPDTAALLGAVRDFVGRFVCLRSEEYYTAMSLWVLHAHAIKAAETSPRIIFKSPEKESGKSRCLEVLDVLTPLPLLSLNSTVAAIFRLLKEEQATLLFDEVDAIFNPKAGNHEDLRALLNAGYRRGATVARVTGDGKRMKVERFPVFACTALAAIGDLPDTVESRAVIVPMRRRAPAEHVEQFRRRTAEAAAVDLREGLRDWAEVFVPILAAARPEIPEGVTDRAADCWEPLLAIAELAGGDWPELGRAAASFVVRGRVAEDASTGVRLLVAVRDVFGGHDRMSSADLCVALNRLEESPWGGWNDGKGINQRDLARRLRPFDVESRNVKMPTGAVLKGYQRADFADAWSRYLRVPVGSATAATNATQIRVPVAPVAPVADKSGCIVCGAGVAEGDDLCERHLSSSATGATNATRIRVPVADVAPVADKSGCIVCGVATANGGDLCGRHAAMAEAAP